ncbi:S-4TM family putative pore-forming effector [Rhizobium leguminosarum]|uniref:S-4TM family putative pore-forming effector n=1 Tax=Rhizobium leguminosarum TaxID=384 RepID=UPI003F964DE8
MYETLGRGRIQFLTANVICVAGKLSNENERTMISTRQDSSNALMLMQARQQVWLVAKRVLVVQFALTVVAALAIGVLNLLFPSLRHITAAIALFLALLDVAFLDRWYKSLLKKNAKIGEEFDTYVLNIPWNDFVVGRRVSPEYIDKASKSYAKRSSDEKLKSWYPPEFSSIPEHIGRLLCQRTNLWYDAELRRQYAYILMAFAFVIVTIGLFVAWFNSLTFPELVIAFMVPATPLLLWCLREIFRQLDTATSQDTTRQSTETLWIKAADSTFDVAKSEAIARQCQDAIYARRGGSSLVFPGVYSWLRPRFEKKMNSVAGTLLEQYKSITANKKS